MLARIDVVEAQQERERTMGSMAMSSWRSDMVGRALNKYDEAIALEELEMAE